MTAPDTAEDSVAILAELIGHPTVSRDSNLALIDWVRRFLDRHGVKSELIYDTERRKANLWASIGPEAAGGIVLSGHTDVVPVEGQDWRSDPFRAKQRESRIFGRGASDMKGFIACVLAQVPAWKRLPLRRPFHLAFSYDEEVGCLGVRGLIDHMRARGYRPSGCLIGEPTGMEVAVAHKGCLCIQGRVHGRAAHASLTLHGVNAIDHAVRLISFMQELATREARQGQRQTGFDVPYSTLATTTIQGGAAPNIIPEHCTFSVDYRYLPGTDPLKLLTEIKMRGAQLSAEMKTAAPESGIELEHEVWALPFATSGNDAWTVLIQKLLSTGSIRNVTFGTEAAYFQSIDIPTVVCGPGSIEQAHQPNESIAVEQLKSCEEFLGNLARNLCNTH